MSTPTTEKKAQAAEEAAKSARDKAQEIEEAIVAGDAKITIEHLEEQERVARVADLAARAARAQVEVERIAARAARIDSIRAEIEKASHGDLPELLRAVEAAVAAFTSAALEYNDNVSIWRSRLISAGCSPINNPDSIADEDRGVAPGTAAYPPSVYIDGRALVGVIDPNEYLGEALLRATETRPRDVYAELKSLGARK